MHQNAEEGFSVPLGEPVEVSAALDGGLVIGSDHAATKTMPRRGMTMKRRDFCLSLVASATLVGLNRPAHAEDTVKVSVPQRGAWDTGVTELGQRGGIFKRHGLTTEILYTQGGAESIQAVIAGSMDIATGVGVSAAVSTFAKGAPIRLIGNEMIGSPDLYWYVTPGSPIHTVADLAGKTIGYSVTGSSSHAGLLELLTQYKIDAKPVATGGMPATLTQTMTGQIDVGWAAAPFGLDLLDEGKIRVVGRGSDVNSLRGRTVRVNVTNLDMLQKRREMLDRFIAAYRETVDWMYDGDAALQHYSVFCGLPAKVVANVRNFIPKEAIVPDRIVGLNQIIADAVKLKFIAEPLSAEQTHDMIQIASATN
jgi:NitT/TauT family transport system substrate-binding protein